MNVTSHHSFVGSFYSGNQLVSKDHHKAIRHALATIKGTLATHFIEFHLRKNIQKKLSVNQFILIVNRRHLFRTVKCVLSHP